MAKKTGKGTRVKNLEEVKDLTKTITEVTKKLGPDMEGVSKSMKGMIDLATAYGEKLTDNKEKGLKYSEAEQNAAKEQAVAAKHLLKMAGSRTIFGKMWHAQKLRSLDLTDKEAKAMQSLAGDQKKLVKAKKGFNKQLEKAKKPLGAIDKAMEGIGSELKEMWKNPMTGIIALGVKWSNLLQKVYDQYGAISKINNDIVKKTTESAHRARELGFEQGDVLKIQNQLNKSFGIGFEEAQSMVDPMLDLAKLSGTSVENTTDLIGALVTMSGYTKESAVDFANIAYQYSILSDVAPGEILADMAENTELLAKYSQGSAENFAMAAVQARKLGITLKEVDQIASGLLNFQSSLSAELEASVMMGRQLNLNRARELALAGDMVGLQQEITNQIGSQSEWNKMNVLQRDALARSIGIGTDALAKMISKEKEATTLMDILNTPMEDIVGEDAMTSLSEMIAKFKSLMILMAEKVFPVINSIATAFLGIVKAMEAVVGEGNAVYVMLGLLVGKMIISATYALVMMVANLAIMISEIGATTLGIGLAIAIPAALGVMAVVGTMIAGAMAMVGDAVVPADGRPMVKPAGSPNTLVGRKDDDILMAPGIAKAGGTTQGGHGTTDVGAQFARGVKELKDEVKKMREDNKSYFGFGGTVAPGVGKSVVGGINDSVRYG